MQVTAKLSNLRTSPRKVRQVIDLVRGKKVESARTILTFTINKSASPVLKLLESAVASAKNSFHLNEADLFVSKITVDEGPKLKRWHPMSRGRAYPIIKRTSHIFLALDDGKGEKKQEETKKSEALNPKSETKPKKRITKTKTKAKK